MVAGKKKRLAEKNMVHSIQVNIKQYCINTAGHVFYSGDLCHWIQIPNRAI